MKQDRETKGRLLASAKNEFMEKGYMQASLRSICKNAGVTTGALYFFFENKEKLFDALVEDAVKALYQAVRAHFEEEQQEAAPAIPNDPGDFQKDLEAARAVVRQMYLHRDALLLALAKSQGTRYETIVDDFIDYAQQHYRLMADRLQQARGSAPVGDVLVHWLAHMQINAFVYIITHIENEDEALACIEKMSVFMVTGWYNMFDYKD